jgi:hypothetical protein
MRTLEVIWKETYKREITVGDDVDDEDAVTLCIEGLDPAIHDECYIGAETISVIEVEL